MWATCLFLIAANATPMAASASLTPAQLRCEYLVDPIGLNVEKPRFSWIVTSKGRDEVQTGYRLIVASSEDNLKRGVGDLWDSGEIASDQTLNVDYGGKPLGPGERAWWSVEVKDKSGHSSGWAKPAYWESGLATHDWKAKWIGRPDPDKLQVDPTSAKWIWYPEGDPAVTAPIGDRQFRYTLHLDSAPQSARLSVAVDDSCVIKVNGHEVGRWTSTAAYADFDPTGALKAGDNLVEITAHNRAARAGLLIAGAVKLTDGSVVPFHTDSRWSASIDGSQWEAAKEVSDLAGEHFQAPARLHGPSPALVLKKQFSTPKQVVRARVYASAKGLYRLFLDGKRVGDDIFTPGWTDYRKRIQYETYDITPELKQGVHQVEMLVGDGWYCGHVGLAGRENYGPKPMGLCQLEIEYSDGSKETIATDGSWVVGSGPILDDDLLMGEDYDARIQPGDWVTPDVQPLDNAVTLVGQHSQTVQELEELKPKSLKEPAPGHFVYDLGQNMVGWARLRVRGTAGDKVTLRFAEMLNPDGTIYTTNLRGARATDSYVLSGKGEEVYEPTFTFHGFRYVELTGYPGRPGMDAITGIVVGSDVPKTGTFECSNPMINQLQHNIIWGQRGNYLEVPTDCPQRDERLGWMGDAEIFVRTATFNNDVAAFMTKWTRDVVDAQGPEGGFSDVSPRMGDQSDGAPAWGDAGVIVPWTIYLAYDDKRILERHYDSMKAWVDYIDSVNPDHIWIKRSNNNFGDWLNVQDDTPRDVLATAFFARSTDLLARTATVLGKTDDSAKYAALRDEIIKAFNDRFVEADGKIKGDTQTDYVLALWFDLLPADKRPLASKRLVDHIMVDRKGHLSTGFVGTGYLCPTLTSIGQDDVAYKLLMNDTYPSWGFSIKQGATTIWERWDGWTPDKGFQDPGMNSFNHYSFGAVGEWMQARVAGIDLDPAQPGYKHILIRPLPGGGLTWAKASYDSVRGAIASSWKLENGEFHLEVTIPANTTATVTVPTSDPASVKLDGKAAGATIQLGSGHYVITAKALS